MSEKKIERITMADMQAHGILSSGYRTTHDGKNIYEASGNMILGLSERIIQARIKLGIPLRNDFFEAMMRIKEGE